MDDTKYRSKDREQARWRTMLLGCAAAIATILVGWALHAAAVVVVPVVFSIFLALLVAPVDRWGINRAPDRLRWLGHVAAMGVILLALVAFLGSVWLASQQVVDRFPFEGGDGEGILSPLDPGSDAESAEAATLSRQESDSLLNGNAAENAADDTESGSTGMLSRLRDLFGTAGGSLTSRFAEWASGYATTVLSAAGSTLGAAVLIFFLTLMMLIEGPRWRKKVANASSGPSRQETMQVVGVIG